MITKDTLEKIDLIIKKTKNKNRKMLKKSIAIIEKIILFIDNIFICIV